MMDGGHEMIYVSRAAAGLPFVCKQYFISMCWGITLGLFWM